MFHLLPYHVFHLLPYHENYFRLNQDMKKTFILEITALFGDPTGKVAVGVMHAVNRLLEALIV